MELQAQQAQRTLFIDTLDLWLILLGATLGVAAWMLWRLGRWADGEGRAYAAYFTSVGVYALATGVWAAAVWPLPGPYNLLFSDAWPLFGVACLVLGLGLWAGARLEQLAVPLAPLGVAPLVYGVDIWAYRLTQEPEVAGLMFFLIGLATLLAPIEARNRSARMLAVAMLAASAAIALFIGVGAAYAHVAGWRAWAPWYGVVRVPAS